MIDFQLSSVSKFSNHLLTPLRQWFSKCGPKPAASALPGTLLEMQILRLHPRPTETAAQRQE